MIGFDDEDDDHIILSNDRLPKRLGLKFLSFCVVDFRSVICIYHPKNNRERIIRSSPGFLSMLNFVYEFFIIWESRALVFVNAE